MKKFSMYEAGKTACNTERTFPFKVTDGKTYRYDKAVALYTVLHNVIDGKIISSCVCVIIPNLTRNVRPYAFVENVVTHEAYRGKGYAGECLDYAKRIALDNNCYKMMLLTGSKKPETWRFYEKAGYNRNDKTAFYQKL